MKNAWARFAENCRLLQERIFRLAKSILDDKSTKRILDILVFILSITTFSFTFGDRCDRSEAVKWGLGAIGLVSGCYSFIKIVVGWIDMNLADRNRFRIVWLRVALLTAGAGLILLMTVSQNILILIAAPISFAFIALKLNHSGADESSWVDEGKTLYHFTDSLEILKAILRSKKFLLKENERPWGFSHDGTARHILFSIPMTCFTEMPHKELRSHCRNFGNFGLGMKIGWAISRGAQNVIYSEHHHPNDFGKTLIEMLDHNSYLKTLRSSYEFSQGIFDSLVGATEQMRYKDEREWRFIGRLTGVNPRTFSPSSVDFQMSDIDVLVVPDSHRVELESFLENIGENNIKVVSTPNP